MTVPATPRRAGPFNGNGVTTSFPFSFKTFDEVDIAVVFVDADGLESSLVLNSDYSVTLNPDQEVAPGGAVTYPVSGTPLASGETLSIVGALPYDQVTDLPTGGSYRAQVVENAFDRTEMQIQQLAEGLSRALVMSPAVDPADVSTQLPAPESLNVIGWNEAATALQNFDPATFATIVAFGTAKAELFSGDGVETVFVLTANPGVQANLDVAVDGITQRPGVDFVWSAGTTLTFTSPPGVGVDNILARYQQGLPTEDSALRIDLADSSDATFGDALLAVKSTRTGAVATTQHEVNERTRHVFDWMTPSQRNAALSNLGVADLTAPLQAAIDSGENLDFGGCLMAVTKLVMSQIGKTYRFNGAALVGIDAAAQNGVVDLRGSDLTIYGLSVSGNWKANYASAIYWHSVSALLPAKSNHLYGVSINNALIGILFGEVSPGVPVDAAQSENYIHGMRTRGVERPIYVNQTNGFLTVLGSEIASSKNEWDIVSPGVYDFTRANVTQVLQGNLKINSSDLIKADTQLGFGIVNSGGVLMIDDSTWEVAGQPLDLSAGRTYVADISGSYWASALNDWAVLRGIAGVFKARNVTINRAPAAAGANQAVINFVAGTGWDVSLDDVTAENCLHWVFRNNNGQPARWQGNTLVFRNCTAPITAGAAAANSFPRITSSTENLLDLRGTDVNGNDIATWYKRDLTDVGAIALNADVPAGTGYPNSIQVTPAVTTGSSEVLNADFTSLATLKATAIKCNPGDTFQLSGWFRMTTAGQGRVDVTYASPAGAPLSSAALADQNDILTATFQFINAIFVAPAGAAYFGVGIRGSSGTVCRMVGLRVSKLA